MKVFTSTDFPGWPAGTVAIVWASSAKNATELLCKTMTERGFRGFTSKSFTLRELNTKSPGVVVLHDGEE